MKKEILNVYNEQYQYEGKFLRDEVHKKGLWHETFHCWLISEEKGGNYIYLQYRSEEKSDFPGLLDITAAGHLLANETVEDGVREVEEELGIHVNFEDLISLGVCKDQLVTDKMIDKELTNVFLLKWRGSMEDFQLQEDEVSGLFKMEIEEFSDLWQGKIPEGLGKGFIIKEDGVKKPLEKIIKRKDIVPHETIYMENLIREVKEYFT